MHHAKELKRALVELNNPSQIQNFLDGCKYNTDPITRSALGVFEMRKAHCFDGALFAACTFEYHGMEPLILDLRSNGNDDDHVIAVYKTHGHFGAVAKSNFVGLRFREPVYRTVRELVLSYFNSYINLERERTLLSYSRPVSLRSIKNIDWRYAPRDVDVYKPLATWLDAKKHYRLYPKKIETLLSKGDQRLLAGETVGLNKRGVFRSGQ